MAGRTVTVKKGLVVINRTRYALLAAVDRVGNFETDTSLGKGRDGITATIAPTNGTGLAPGAVVQVSIEGRFCYRKLSEPIKEV